VRFSYLCFRINSNSVPNVFKVGVTKSIEKYLECILKGQTPYITVNRDQRNYRSSKYRVECFLYQPRIEGGDIIVSINEKPYSLDTIYEMITESTNWKENDAITVKIKRDGKSKS
jgi:hypothetical protein